MKLKLIEKKTEVPGVETFVFEPSEPLEWKAGQYLHYVLHHEPTDERGSDRWFTISSAPFTTHPAITTRITGEGGSSFKTRLASLAIGKSIEISATEGDFTLDDSLLPVVFVAGGIGVTPFHSIITQLDHDRAPMNITLIYANRDDQIPFRDVFDTIAARDQGLTVHYRVGELLDAAKILELAPQQDAPIFYISGPEPMVDKLMADLKEAGIPDERLKGDWFPGYESF
ncbi:MAG TPA: FAD-dependent oxidoreductase [Candidatus Paceibacterota bacterium]|nr:FAD-dependent oxidoreductase [Candidatus Paceibacterota bacterium]